MSEHGYFRDYLIKRGFEDNNKTRILYGEVKILVLNHNAPCSIFI